MKFLFDWFIKLFASLGGVGYIRFASGTFASLVTLALFYVLNPFANGILEILVPILLFPWFKASKVQRVLTLRPHKSQTFLKKVLLTLLK